jgi:hypothetical protein
LDTPQRRAKRLLGAWRPADETWKSSPEFGGNSDAGRKTLRSLETCRRDVEELTRAWRQLRRGRKGSSEPGDLPTRRGRAHPSLKGDYVFVDEFMGALFHVCSLFEAHLDLKVSQRSSETLLLERGGVPETRWRVRSKIVVIETTSIAFLGTCEGFDRT